jgi:hypothetical protein
MGATSGNVTVTATNTCGTSTASIKAITITSAPATPGLITGTATLCSGSTGNIYSIAAVAGATSYTWTVPAGATVTAGQGTISATVTMGATSGNVTVTATNTCGTSTASIKAITITSAPAAPGVITGTTTLCSSSTGNIYSIAAVAGATSYTWTVPAGATVTAGQGTISATVTMGATSGNVTVTASNGCGTSSAAIISITLNSAAPATPGAITGSLTPCSGSAGNVYSIVAVPGATSYTWTVPAGATITAGQGTISATVTMGVTSGNITVNASSSCGTSTDNLLTITVNNLPVAPGLISGTVALCSESTGNVYSIAAVAGATSYTWTVPAGATITAGQGTISATVSMGATTGDVTVTASNTCGTSAASNQNIVVNPIPSTPIVSIIDGCGSSTLTSDATGTIVWSTLETSASISVLTSGTYTVVQTINGCSSIAGSGNASPFIIPTVTLNTFSDVCINTPIFAMSGGSPIGGTYSGTGVTSNQFDPSIAGFGTFTIDYLYTDINGCFASDQQTITVGCAGLDELGSVSLTLYPNPTEGIFSLIIKNDVMSKVNIFDASGRLVKNVINNNHESEMKIDLTHFADGIYSIEIYTNQGVIRKKVTLTK